jgi:dTDP-glucose 4,6-dehydratase
VSIDPVRMHWPTVSHEHRPHLRPKKGVMKILITGGCGFIGSNFVRHVLAADPRIKITVVDLLTYAGNLANLDDVLDNGRLHFIRGDIVDRSLMRELVAGADAVINFAAESHVDRSILDASPFVRTNINGTQVLLDLAVETRLERYIQISTDEVYGSLGPVGRFTESTPLAPNSPYSASKAAADMLVRAYQHTHGLPAVIVRSSNAYGPYQFPEKLIPLMIANAFEGKPLPVYGDGQHVRDWVHVLDFCSAILRVLEDGNPGEIYNVGGGNEMPNLEVVKMILRLTGRGPDLIRFVPDRPGHDRRYAMDHSKLSHELGWHPERTFEEGISATVDWYRSNPDWVSSVRSGAYYEYYDLQYASRLARADVASA